MSCQTCCCRGHLPRCFNAPYFLLTRGQFSTRAVHDSESCVSRAHYHWNLVIYLSASFVHLLYTFYYIIITPLPTYLPPYLFHMKAGPRLPTSGGSVLILIQSCRSFSEVKHCTGSVDPAGCFQKILFKQTRACHRNKFGSKCDAFGADMSSSAPGISCSKVPVLGIGSMNHHRDYWAQCKMC